MKPDNLNIEITVLVGGELRFIVYTNQAKVVKDNLPSLLSLVERGLTDKIEVIMRQNDRLIYHASLVGFSALQVHHDTTLG